MIPRTTHLSERGIPLVYGGDGVLDRPIVTVELYCKWYALYLVHPDGRVESVGFDTLEDYANGGSAYCDHVPNPEAVARFAAKNDYYMDDLAMEMIIGRWEREYRGRYAEEDAL